MHAKFICDNIDDIHENLFKILGNQQSFGYMSDKYPESLVALKAFQKVMFVCGQTIDDYPDSFGFHLTSRLLSLYGINQYITKLIDDCDILSPSVCAFVSPYNQLPEPGGTLSSSISKHNEPITQFIHLEKFLVTYSASKLSYNTLRMDPFVLTHLFEIKLPTAMQLRQYLSNNTNKKQSYNHNEALNDERIEENPHINFKFIFDLEKYQDDAKSFDHPDLLPCLFLIIKKYYVYLITPNKQLKFVYASNKNLEHEILNAFCIGYKQIMIVEKNSTNIKIFPDFELNPYYYDEIDVCKENKSIYIKNVLTPNNNYVMNSAAMSVSLAIILNNDQIVNYYFQYKPNDEELDADESFGSDSSDSSDYFRNDNRELLFSSSSTDNKKIRRILLTHSKKIISKIKKLIKTYFLDTA